MINLLAASAALTTLVLASPTPTLPLASPGTLLITPLTPDNSADIRTLASSPCTTYHGIVGTAGRSAIFYAPAGCGVDRSGGGGQGLVEFGWGEGELAWAGQTEVDEGVVELRERKEQLSGAFREAWLTGEGDSVGGGTQLRFGASHGPKLVAHIDGVSWTASELLNSCRFSI